MTGLRSAKYALHNVEGFACIELGRFPHDAKNCEAIHPAALVKRNHGVDRSVIKRPVREERRGGNGENTLGVGGKRHDLDLVARRVEG